MDSDAFRGPDGGGIAAVTTAEMRDVDRVAVEDVGLQLLQMMENAGRTLAAHVRAVGDGPVVVVAGNGGNGGGGLACARHLANGGRDVRLLLDRPPAELSGAASTQYGVLEAMEIPAATGPDELPDRPEATVVDALVGYGLDGPLRGPAADLVPWMNAAPGPIVSLDVPSGRDATSGEVHGAAVTPDRTVTLALPKTGLTDGVGRLVLADISIPAVVYDRLDIPYEDPFGDETWIDLEPV